MAENLTFDINAKDNASATLNKVTTNLQKMQKNVQATTTTFEKFRSTLLALGTVNFVRTAFQFADAIQDISDATNIATSSILGFSTAVAQNGGNAEKAQSSILKLVENIGDAANGSAKAQKAFADVGITLEDLRTLSEQDILEKTVQGLAGIDDYSKRAAAQTELLGKTLKGVNIAGVATSLGTATAEGAKYTASIKAAADTQQNLENSINNLKIALLDVLTPISDVAKQFTANIEIIKTFIKTALTIGAVIASFTLVGKVFATLSSIIRILTVSGLGLSRVFIALGEFFSGAFSATLLRIAAGFANIAKNILLSIPGIRKLQTLLAPLVATLAGAFTGFKLFGDQTALSGKKAEDAIKRMNEESMKAHAESTRQTEEKKTQIREVIDATQKQITEIQNVTAAYKQSQNQLIENLNTETRYLQMSDDAVEIEKVRSELYDRAIAQITELQNKKSILSKEEQNLVPIIDAQIASIQNSITKDQLRAETAIKNTQNIRKAQEDLRKSVEDVGRAFQQNEALQDLRDELELIGLTGEELEKRRTILAAEKALREEMQRLTISLLELDTNRVKIGEEAYNKERERITQQMQDAQDLANAKIKAFEDQKKREAEIEQDYMKGARDALSDIAKSYKPINLAQDAVRKGWQNIESAVDSFVETGKLNFSDFARSVLQDLAKMIAKAMIFKAISTALGAFGLSIPGLAEGGPAKKGQPYIVGEKGPELFVPQGNGTVVPNNKLQSSNSTASTGNAPATNIYNTYNINALDAKSVAQLFAENRKAIFGANKMAEREMSYAGAR